MFNNKKSPDSQEHFSSWKKIPIPEHQARAFHASVVYNDLLVVFGGREPANTPFAVDLTHQKLIPVNVHSELSKAVQTICLNDDGSIIAHGGYSGRENMEYMTVQNISQNEIEIQSRKPVLAGRSHFENPPLQGHTANVYGNNMYVFGGLNHLNSTENQLWELDLKNTCWTRCAFIGEAPEKRYLHSSALYKNSLYIFGGNPTPFDSPALNDLWKLDLNNFTVRFGGSKEFQWELVDTTGTPPSSRYGASMQEFKGKLFLFGGRSTQDTGTFSDGFFNDVFTFCTKTNVWGQLQLKPGPSPRMGHTSFIWNNQFYIFGGAGSSEQAMSDMWCFSLEDSEENSEIANKKTGADRGLIIIENDPFCLIDLFVGKSFTDIVLEVEGKEFPCHKSIISQRCKFFANLFSSGMADSNLTKLRITDVKADSFEVMLRFIYGDPKLTIDEGLAFELLGLSDKYLLPRLKAQCEIVLTKLLALENFTKVAKAAEMVESDVLKEAVFKFARQNISTLKERGDLINLSQSLLIEFFASIVTK